MAKDSGYSSGMPAGSGSIVGTVTGAEGWGSSGSKSKSGGSATMSEGKKGK